MKILRDLACWFDDRLGLRQLRRIGGEKTVPSHRHSWVYYLGGAVILLIAIQVFTGLLLLLYYDPDDGAHASVRAITEQIPYGKWFRSVHSITATLVIGAVLLHMTTTFFLRAYRKPREMTWVTGNLMLLALLGIAFTGYALPMDTRGYFAANIGIGLVNEIPLIGPQVCRLVFGGNEVTAATLGRLFALHIGTLPVSILLLTGAHLWMVQFHGIAGTEPMNGQRTRRWSSEPYYPTFLRKELLLWLCLLVAVSALAGLLPASVGAEADPFSPPPRDIHPEWYFMSPFYLLRFAGAVLPGGTGEFLVLTFVVAALLLWLTTPFLDGDAPPNSVRLRAVRLLGIFFLAGWVLTTIMGFVNVYL